MSFATAALLLNRQPCICDDFSWQQVQSQIDAAQKIAPQHSVWTHIDQLREQNELEEADKLEESARGVFRGNKRGLAQQSESTSPSIRGGGFVLRQQRSYEPKSALLASKTVSARSYPEFGGGPMDSRNRNQGDEAARNIKRNS